MTTVLGLDAAWTAHEPSGVALVAAAPTGWKCLVVAPSYQAFLDFASGRPIDWESRPTGTEPDAKALLKAAATIAGWRTDVVAIDMPVSTRPILGRRLADEAVSREFGDRWCSTHTPSRARPGPIGSNLTRVLCSLGYRVATRTTPQGTRSRLVEVYPHPALLALLDRPKRVPYKVSKASRYWPKSTPQGRAASLLREFEGIYSGLSKVFGPLPLSLPAAGDGVSIHVLKGYEDALDALVSAWVGTLYLESRAVPLGDRVAAIWCPASVVRGHQARRAV